MSASCSSCSDQERLAALYRYEILDTPAERDFDDVCTLAAQLCQAPLATLTFVDGTRQWFKSELGMGVRETPLDNSICRHAIFEEETLVVPDTLLDARFQANPFCAGEASLRFYAGAVIRTDDGFPLGTVCVLDRRPRELSQGQIDGLRTLARQVMTMLELRRRNRELHQMQADLSKALESAEAVAAAKDDFLAKLSHELRTPLTPVVMTAGALLEEPSLPHAMREDIAMILRNVELETRLIDDLLDVTRIAHGKLELELRDCDLHQIAEDAVRVCRSALEGKGIRVDLNFTASRHHTRGDATRLQQVFWNLLTNAAKFTPAGGCITLATRNETSESGVRWLFSVSDTGRGIAPEVLPGLFGAFEQGGRAVTRHFGGLGLGLAICKGVVDLHGGIITAASEGVDRGATFTISLEALPLAEMNIAASAQFPAAEAAPDAALRILLVEDHEATASVLCRLLRRAGHSVKHAPTLHEARRLVQTGIFDLAMSDLGLPDGSGLELMSELRDRHGLRGIALSGYGMEEDVRLSRAAGFVAHLTKPVDLGQLRRTLHEISAG